MISAIDNQIKKLEPFFGEDLITFPNFENGDFSPQVNIYQFFGGENAVNDLEEFTNQNFQIPGVVIHYEVEEIEQHFEDDEEIEEFVEIETWPEYLVGISIWFEDENLGLDTLLKVAQNIIDWE